MKNFDVQLEAIVKDLKLPQAGEQLMLESIYENLKSRIGMRLALELSEPDLIKIQPLIDSEDGDQIFNQLNALVPNFDQLLEEEIREIRLDLGLS